MRSRLLTASRIRRPAALLVAAAALAGCQTPAKPVAMLGANAMGCKSRETLALIHGSGERFQRIADDHLANGGCRIFPAASLVADKAMEGGLLRFRDASTGTVYWAAPPG